ncbi:MAG TPA: hypothetical protein VGI19_03640 [Candidatus Cybelea sp.]
MVYSPRPRGVPTQGGKWEAINAAATAATLDIVGTDTEPKGGRGDER